MNSNHNNHPDSLQDAVIRSFDCASIPPIPDEVSLIETLRTTDSAESFEVSDRSSLFWRILHMKYTKPVSSAAALLILGITVAVVMISPGITPQQALARMAGNLKNAEAFTCHAAIQGSGDAIEGFVQARGSFARIEMERGGRKMVTVIDHAKGKMLTYAIDSGQAMLMSTAKASAPPDLAARLKSLTKDDAKFLREERLGQDVLFVYEVDNWGGTGLVWVDSESLLPVRLEMREKGGKGTAVYSDFDWSVTLDPSLFSLEAPEGYTVRKMDL